MNKIRTILVEDSHMGIQALESKLNRYCAEDIEIIAACESYEDALEKIIALSPDLIFLDIHLKDKNGFDLLDVLPSITFELAIISDDPGYVSKAFEVEAIHYIVKPYEPNKLKDAVARAKRKLANRKKHSGRVRIALNSSRGFLITHTDEIIYCEADNNYCEVFMIDRKHVLSKPLKYVEGKIKGKDTDFIRISAKHLINLNFAKDYVRASHVTMSNGKNLSVSRRFQRDFEALLQR